MEEEPRLPGGFPGPFPRDGAPLLFLEMGTTRLIPWCSELVRVRTGVDLSAAEVVFGVPGLIPVGGALEEGGFLDSLEEVTDFDFLLVEGAASVFSLAV